MSEDDKKPAPDLFPYDEMSTGVASSLQRRANYVTGKPPDLPAEPDPALKPRTGAYYAFRPTAPPAQPAKSGTGTALNPAFKPGGTGTTPAYKPGTGTTPAYKPGTGATPAYKPGTGTTPALKTGSFAPLPPADESPALGEEDDGKLQTHLRAMALSDPAGVAARATAPRRPPKLPPSAAEDTFVKRKMKEAEKNVPDFSLDEDLG